MAAPLTEPAVAPRRRLLAGIALLLVVAMALWQAWPAVRAILPPASPPAPGAATVASTDEVRVLAGEPASIDPAYHGDLGSAQVAAQLFETLTAVDPSLTVRPALAESWTVEDAGRQVTFTLRPDLAFSDGTPLTAADVVRSWRRLVNPRHPSPLASLIADVRGVRDLLAGRSTDPSTMGVRAEGDRTVVVDLEQAGGDLPAIVSSAPFAVVPPGAGDAEIPLDPAGFVGSGGYVLAGVEANAIVLRANDRYWAGTPAIRTVRLVTSLEGASPVEAFSNGDLDYAPIGGLDASWIAYDATLGPALREDPSLSVTYYGFDASRPPFDDARVRQAFALAVDWRRLAALDEPGSSIAASGMVPAGIPNRPDGDYLPPYDPVRARQLLADAGYPGGRGFPDVRFLTSGGGYDGAVKASIDSALGITLSYATMDFGDYTTRLEQDPPAVWSLIWVADFPGPNDFLGVLLGSGSTANYGRWSSAPFDAAIRAATAAADPDAARAGYADALAVVRDEAPVIPVSYGTSWALVRGGLLGATAGGTGILRLAGLAWTGGS